MQRLDNDEVTHYTDQFKDGNNVSRCKRAWTGVTVFQISAETRKELGMTAQALTARKTAKTAKVQQQRAVKKDQKGETNEADSVLKNVNNSMQLRSKNSSRFSRTESGNFQQWMKPTPHEFSPAESFSNGQRTLMEHPGQKLAWW